MALQSTPYKVELNLTDLDRGVYENLRFTVAKHPSETEERMAVRLIAYALFYNEQLAFVAACPMWTSRRCGKRAWTVACCTGSRSASRTPSASPGGARGAPQRTSLLAYGNLRVWQGKVVDAVKTLKNVHIAALPQEPLAELARDLPRSISWSLMISEDTLFVTDERGQQHELQLEWLLGERG